MIVRLLDVNVLVSLLDSAHVHHHAALRWFQETAGREGWATCPLTENGLIRVVTQPRYPNFRLTQAQAAASLAAFKANFAGIHQFWPDSISATETDIFDWTALTGPRQITDAYLAALALRHRGRLATLDESIAWKAVRGATAELIEQIPNEG